MKKLSEMTVLVKDSGGLGIEHAVAMGKAAKECLYFNTWQDGFCLSKKYFLGRGFEDIKKTLYFDDEVDDADIIMYTDIGHGDNAARFRREQKRDGKRAVDKKGIFGAGDAEKLENHRFAFRVLQKKIGLYPPPYKTYKAIGIDDLIDYLQRHPNQFVKVDNPFRGDCESFPAYTYDQVKTHIDNLKVKFAPFDDEVPFTVEDMVESKAEIGYDGMFSNELLQPVLWGVESEKCYIGRFGNLPPVLQDCADKLGPELKKRNYYGACSVEMRIISKDKGVLIDPTMRPPYNLSTGFTEWIENYAAVIKAVAFHEPITIKPRAKYVGGAPLYVKNEEESVPWDFPKSIRDEGKIKFRECGKKKGKYYALRGCNSAAFIISWGNSVKEVIEDIKNTADQVKATDIDKKSVLSIEHDVLPQINALKDLDIEF